MIFEISVQKYTEKIIFHRKIFPLKISPYSPSAFYFLSFDPYPPTGENFHGKYFTMKTKFFGIFLHTEFEYDTHFPSQSTFDNQNLEKLPIFCLMNFVYLEG
jgi:hypothetical protein